MSGTVKLSKTQQNMLRDIPSAKVRAATKAKWLQRAAERKAKSKAFLEEVMGRKLEVKLTDHGNLSVANTGTRYSFCVIRQERIQDFLSQLQAVLASKPQLQVQPEDEVEADDME